MYCADAFCHFCLINEYDDDDILQKTIIKIHLSRNVIVISHLIIQI